MNISIKNIEYFHKYTDLFILEFLKNKYNFQFNDHIHKISKIVMTEFWDTADEYPFIRVCIVSKNKKRTIVYKKVEFKFDIDFKDIEPFARKQKIKTVLNEG